MFRYFIYLAYDGTNYHGWQIQPNGSSVQETLMKALHTFLRDEAIEVVGAGRTDAGVHARLMVAHFDVEWMLDEDTVTDKLNRLLPPDISVYRVRRVNQDAHARFDATYRTYKYYVTTQKNPFNRAYCWRLFQPLDFAKMNEAAQTLFDYTDFTSFSKLHTDVKTNNCKIMHAHWDQVSETEWYRIPEMEGLYRFHQGIVHFSGGIRRNMLEADASGTNNPIDISGCILRIIGFLYMNFFRFICNLNIRIHIKQPERNVDTFDLIDMIFFSEYLRQIFSSTRCSLLG